MRSSQSKQRRQNATEAPNGPAVGDETGAIQWVDEHRYTGSELSALLDQVRKELGAEANIVKADRVRTGGVAGFFARETFEVVAASRRDGSAPTPNPTAAPTPAPTAALVAKPETAAEISAALLARAEAISAQERDELRRDRGRRPNQDPPGHQVDGEPGQPDDQIHDLRDEATVPRPFNQILEVELRRPVVPPPEGRTNARRGHTTLERVEPTQTTVSNQPVIVTRPVPLPAAKTVPEPKPLPMGVPAEETPAAPTAPTARAVRRRAASGRRPLLDRDIVTVVGSLPAARLLAENLMVAENRELVVLTKQAFPAESATAVGRRYEDVSRHLHQWRLGGHRGVVVLDVALGSSLGVELRCLQSLGSDLVRLAVDASTNLDGLLSLLDRIDCPVVADHLTGETRGETTAATTTGTGLERTDLLLERGVPVIDHGHDSNLIRYPAPMAPSRSGG